MRRVGILGGGQLGLMLAESLHRLDARVAVYDPAADAPCATRLPDVTTSPWTDVAALDRFAARCDVLTYEFENVPAGPLARIASRAPLRPALGVLEVAQNRVREKLFLAEQGLPHVPFGVIPAPYLAESAARAFGFPLILKSAAGGYDGKGQRRVESMEALREAVGVDPDQSWVMEAPIEILTEVSCIVARTTAGEEIVFPPFENLHAHHILDFTVFPARVSPRVAEAARTLALTAARALDVVGLLTVEFFLGRDTRSGATGHAVDGVSLFVNELAPRPHNSGHVTRQACTFSQFDALARVLLDLPLHAPRAVGEGGWCMGNLLGDVWLAQRGVAGKGESTLDLGAWAHHPDVLDVYLYGKREARAGRKMGHFVARGADGDGALAAARAFRAALVAGLDLAAAPGPTDGVARA